MLEIQSATCSDETRKNQDAIVDMQILLTRFIYHVKRASCKLTKSPGELHSEVLPTIPVAAAAALGNGSQTKAWRLRGNDAYFPFQRTELYKTDTSQTWCVQQQQHQHQLRSRSNSHLHKRVNYRKTTICAAATRTVQQHQPSSQRQRAPSS